MGVSKSPPLELHALPSETTIRRWRPQPYALLYLYADQSEWGCGLACVVRNTPLGWTGVAASCGGVHAVAFGHASTGAALAALGERTNLPSSRLRGRLRRIRPNQSATAGANADAPSAASSIALAAQFPRDAEARTAVHWGIRTLEALGEYALGLRREFSDIRLCIPPEPAFRAAVLRACAAIPFGQTITYAELARRAGAARAARAVGNVMAGNQLPILIPCHRVVRSDRRMGGYSGPGGAATKQTLIDFETAHSNQPQTAPLASQW